jgi:streptogramin lyase
MVSITPMPNFCWNASKCSGGNGAEALRTYERCRTLLADELGAYPSSETEAVYLEILRGGARDAPSAGPDPPAVARRPTRRLVAAALAVAVLVAALVVAAVGFSGGAEAPPEILPNSVVRLDPETLKPTTVVEVGPLADLVVATGGYVWVTHGVLRYADTGLLNNSGDRTLTRIDPSTGVARVVGGVAPCGIAGDPSGDVWVANCFADGAAATVKRVDAKTLRFEKTFRVPSGTGFYRGLVYGGGSLWVGETDQGLGPPVLEVDPKTGARRPVSLDHRANWLAWSGGYGDLWVNDFDGGRVSRLHADTGLPTTYESVVAKPGSTAPYRDAVWVGDWAAPEVTRLPVAGGSRRTIHLPARTVPSGVTLVAAGADAVWAAVPDDHAVFRIDPRTGLTRRIDLKYYPWGVAVGDDGVWVSVRAHDA